MPPKEFCDQSKSCGDDEKQLCTVLVTVYADMLKGLQKQKELGQPFSKGILYDGPSLEIRNVLLWWPLHRFDNCTVFKTRTVNTSY
jgi:hypothetical protein